jgi:hypothetical protein
MYLSSEEISQIYLLQVVTPNYLNRVSLTTACLFITKYLTKLKVSTYYEIQENTH